MPAAPPCGRRRRPAPRGLGNPVLSLLEDVGSGLLTLLAFVLPVLALLVVVALLAGIVLPWRRMRRGLGAGARGSPPLR
jgi:Domain of unknown function (DUF4126)